MKTGLYSVFPIANVEVLQTLLDQNILDHQTQPTHIANLACLVAFTALVTELHRLEPAFSDTDPDSYLRAALSLLPRLVMEAANLRTLEAFTLIVSFCHYYGLERILLFTIRSHIFCPSVTRKRRISY